MHPLRHLLDLSIADDIWIAFCANSALMARTILFTVKASNVSSNQFGILLCWRLFQPYGTFNFPLRHICSSIILSYKTSLNCWRRRSRGVCEMLVNSRIHTSFSFGFFLTWWQAGVILSESWLMCPRKNLTSSSFRLKVCL